MPAPKIPESYHCNTGEQHEAYKRIDEFFKDVTDFIGIDGSRLKTSQFETRVAGHTRENGQPTDDFTHMLIYHPREHSERVVACVAEFRTEFNWIQFDFFHNLQNIVEGENLFPRLE